MAKTLNYAANCYFCGGLMPAGSLMSWHRMGGRGFRDAKFKPVHLEGNCPMDPPLPAQVRRELEAIKLPEHLIVKVLAGLKIGDPKP